MGYASDNLAREARLWLVAAFPDMLRRDRELWGMRVCHVAWRFGVSVRDLGPDLQAVRVAADIRGRDGQIW